MPNKINELDCFEYFGNTGRPFCVEDLGTPIGVIATPWNRVLTREEVEDLEATLNAAATDDLPRNRFFYIGPFDVVAPAGDDRQQQTFSTSGRKRTIRRGKVGWTMTMASYGKHFHTALMTFDGKEDQYNFLLVTKAEGTHKISGYEKKDAAGLPGLSGFNLSDLFVGDYKLADGSNGYEWVFAFELADSSQWNNRIGVITTDFDVPEAMAGLQTARLVNLTPKTGGTANKLTIQVNASGINLQTVYGADLAQTAAWRFRKKSDGTTVIVSGVAQLNGNYVVTLTTATGLEVVGGLVIPSELAALADPVEGIESETITALVP